MRSTVGTATKGIPSLSVSVRRSPHPPPKLKKNLQTSPQGTSFLRPKVRQGNKPSDSPAFSPLYLSLSELMLHQKCLYQIISVRCPYILPPRIARLTQQIGHSFRYILFEAAGALPVRFRGLQGTSILTFSMRVIFMSSTNGRGGFGEMWLSNGWHRSCDYT